MLKGIYGFWSVTSSAASATKTPEKFAEGLLGPFASQDDRKHATSRRKISSAAVAVLDEGGGKSRSGHASFGVRSLDCGYEVLTA